MYSTKKDSMTIPVQVHAWHKTTETSALLDSGATHNFIDTRAIKSLGLGTRILSQPWIVHNVDGTTNREGTITRYCNLWVRKGEQTTKLGFFVANLGHDRIILGHPWFKACNPTINWTTNTLLGPKISIKTAGCVKVLRPYCQPWSVGTAGGPHDHLLPARRQRRHPITKGTQRSLP